METVAVLLRAGSSAVRPTSVINNLAADALLTAAANTPIESVKPRALLAPVKIK